MKTELMENLKQWLEDEKRRLNTELSRFSHRNPMGSELSFDAHNSEKDDDASEVAQFSDNLSVEDELEKALRDVESALAQMAKGEYGTCKYCHQPIDERRLLARPTSTSCIQCKKTLTQEM